MVGGEYDIHQEAMAFYVGRSVSGVLYSRMAEVINGK